MPTTGSSARWQVEPATGHLTRWSASATYLVVNSKVMDGGCSPDMTRDAADKSCFMRVGIKGAISGSPGAVIGMLQHYAVLATSCLR